MSTELMKNNDEEPKAGPNEPSQERSESPREAKALAGEGKGSLAERILAIGRDCAAHVRKPYRSVDHADLLYDELGLPK